MAGRPWLLVDEVPLTVGARVVLDPAESRHAAGSIRLAAGDLVAVADGAGRVAEAVLVSVSGRRCEVEIRAVTVEQASPPEGPTLAIGVLHSQAMDWAVQKSVEIGVSSVIPILADRSQLGKRAVRGRLDHWRRVARQAIKQCRRPWFLVVREPASVADVIAERGDRVGFVADADGVRPWQIDGPVPDIVVVGPEGGLTSDELGALDRAGWIRLRLGPHVLRSDTAAVIASSVLMTAAERRNQPTIGPPTPKP